MLFEHSLLLVGMPLILFLVGTISKKSIPLVMGSIGLVVIGIMILASPIAIQQLDNVTKGYTYDNVTQASNTSAYEWQLNETTENYFYTQTELPENDNLIYGALLSLIGIAGIAIGALTLRE